MYCDWVLTCAPVPVLCLGTDLCLCTCTVPGYWPVPLYLCAVAAPARPGQEQAEHPSQGHPRRQQDLQERAQGKLVHSVQLDTSFLYSITTCCYTQLVTYSSTVTTLFTVFNSPFPSVYNFVIKILILFPHYSTVLKFQYFYICLFIP